MTTRWDRRAGPRPRAAAERSGVFAGEGYPPTPRACGAPLPLAPHGLTPARRAPARPT
jgi:hypothetical protein